MTDFEKFPKIPRSAKFNYMVTEKIDGTNAQILIEELDGTRGVDLNLECLIQDEDNPSINHTIKAGSRNRWISPEDDNFGFARYVWDNAEELLKLGPGRHFGEWYGSGIQRGYGLSEKRFALFNAGRWTEPKEMSDIGLTNAFPGCNVDVVPILGYVDARLDFRGYMEDLHKTGSKLVPDFMDPEGIVLCNSKHNILIKETFEFTEGKWKEE